MKTITIHIGNPKTGTTSIQETLKANCKLLEKNGLLYPLENSTKDSFRKWSNRNHRGLVILAEPDRNCWTRSLRGRIPESMVATAVDHEKQIFERVLKRIASSEADHVVISSESLGGLTRNSVARLKALFDPLNAKIRVLCYYRHPVQSYLSKIQQRMKASGSKLNFQKFSRPISKKYEKFSAVFGDAVTIRSFDQANSRQGDVVDDFLSFVGVDDATIKSLKRVNKNISDPAEVIVAQYWIRSRAFMDLEGVFAGPNRQLNLALARAAEGLELNRPALKENVANTVLYNNRDELRWLKSKLGIVFDGIDYDNLDVQPELDLNSAGLEEILQFDQSKVDQLIARTIRELCGATE